MLWMIVHTRHTFVNIHTTSNRIQANLETVIECMSTTVAMCSWHCETREQIYEWEQRHEPWIPLTHASAGNPTLPRNGSRLFSVATSCTTSPLQAAWLMMYASSSGGEVLPRTAVALPASIHPWSAAIHLELFSAISATCDEQGGGSRTLVVALYVRQPACLRQPYRNKAGTFNDVQLNYGNLGKVPWNSICKEVYDISDIWLHTFIFVSIPP
jgi:hypothetical protein